MSDKASETLWFDLMANCSYRACVEILSNIVSAMDPIKSRILLDEMVVPDLLAQDSQRFMNQIDMTVVLTLNGKERSAKEWDSLITMVDGKLETEKTWWRKGEEGSHWGVQQLRLHGSLAN